MLTPEQIASYREQGYLVVERVVDPGRLAVLRRVVDELVERARGLTDHTDVYDLEDTHAPEAPRVRRIKQPHLRHPAFAALVADPTIVAILVALIGPDVRLQNTKLNLKAAGYGAPVEWHQDWAFYPHTNDDVLATGLYLDDCDLDNGPLLVVPGSHRGPTHDHHADGYFCGALDPERSGVDVSAAVPLTGPAGSLTIHHARLVHGSALNVSRRPRRLLLHEYRAADAWPLLGVADFDAFQAQMVTGRPTLEPRIVPTPVRMPLPVAKHQGSIYENQRGAGRRYFAAPAAPPGARSHLSAGHPDPAAKGGAMRDQGLSRRKLLAAAAGAGATLALGRSAPAVVKGANLRLWILKTYVEPTNKAIEASAQRWAQKNGATVTVEYFTFEDMQTKYVAAIENKNTPDVGQLETGAPARFAGMGQLLDLTDFARSVESQVGKPPANVAPVTVVGGKTYAIPWYVMPAFWYVWRDVLEKQKLKLPETFEDAKKVAHAVNRPGESFYGMGQSWNRTSDGYGVMQSLMYSYGVGWAGRDGKYRSIKTPAMQQVMRWATDIYREGIQPPDTLSWTGSQNNEAFIARKIAQTSNGPSITFALENALAKATDARERKQREEALANHVALPHPAGPDGRRMWGLAISMGVFKSTKNPDAAMSLVSHIVSPEETLAVMRESYGQFAPVLDRAREASKDYFNKNENYRTFGRAAEWFVGTGWPGPVTAAAAEVQASNVLTDAPAKVIVDKWSIDQAIDWADKKIKEIYETLG